MEKTDKLEVYLSLWHLRNTILDKRRLFAFRGWDNLAKRLTDVLESVNEIIREVGPIEEQNPPTETTPMPEDKSNVLPFVPRKRET